MVTPVVGAVVLVPFPFSDLSASKLRPALIVAASGRGDWVCVQITSQPYSDPLAVELTETDFQEGSLHRPSFIRPGKLFTASQFLFRRRVGIVSRAKLQQARTAIIALLQANAGA